MDALLHAPLGLMAQNVVSQLTTEVHQCLSQYCSSRLPVIFKNLPSVLILTICRYVMVFASLKRCPSTGRWNRFSAHLLHSSISGPADQAHLFPISCSSEKLLVR